MEIGKIPESILKRAVFRQIHTKRDEVLVGAGVGEDCAVMQLAPDEVFVLSTDPITGTEKDMGTLALQITANDLASAGAEPVGVLLTVLLPPSADEPLIRRLMQEVECACEKLHIQVMGGHTEVTAVVNQPVISVTGKNGCYVIGGIAESSYDKLKEGRTVMVTSWNTGNSYEATITSIGNSPVESMKSSENPNMSYYPFTAVVEKDADLSSGEGVSISVDGLSGDSGNSIYLERMFIREDGNRSYVYKKGKHGRLEKQYVEVGKNMYGSIEIVSGLTMEDEIAFPYGRNVKEGAKTKTVESLYDYN